MKVTRILAVVLLLAMVASAASAQELTRLSWNNCVSWVVNQNFTGPAAYKLVCSVLNASGDYSGHDTNLTIGPIAPLPDAWRFDDAGCDAGLGTIAFTKFSTACPALQGGAPLAITNWGYDLGTGKMIVRIANTFNAFTATATQRYTVWTISFDMTGADVGNPGGGICGGADVPENLVAETQFLHTDGHFSQTVSGERYATWNGGVLPVPAQPSTWSNVKGLYR